MKSLLKCLFVGDQGLEKVSLGFTGGAQACPGSYVQDLNDYEFCN